MDKDTLVQKYLYNELSEEEYRTLEQEVESNSDFAEEVKLSTVIFEDTRSEFKKTLKDSYRSKAEKTSIPNSVKKKILYAFIFAIVLALVVFGIYRITQNETPSSAPSPIPTEERGNIATSSENPLMEAVYKYTYEDGNKYQFKKNIAIKAVGHNLWDAYDKNEHNTVIATIEKIENPNSKQRFLLGLSYLYTTAYDEAVQQFEILLSNSEYKDSALWYISLTYLNQAHLEEGKSYLKGIVASSNHSKKNEAKELLKLIEDDNHD